jgi:glc operon protein GlcG
MKKLILSLLIIIPLISIAQAQVQPYLNLEEAMRTADAAEEKARQENWNVVIAILDGGGHLIYLRRMDGVQIGSVDVAQAKAKSAVYFKRSTKVFEDLVKSGGTHILSLPNAIPVEGGLPIFKDGVCVGAIGISGVTSAQDGMIAEAGLKAL